MGPLANRCSTGPGALDGRPDSYEQGRSAGGRACSVYRIVYRHPPKRLPRDATGGLKVRRNVGKSAAWIPLRVVAIG